MSVEVFRMLVGIGLPQLEKLIAKGVFRGAMREDGTIWLKRGIKLYLMSLKEGGAIGAAGDVKLKLELLKYNRERALLVYRPAVEHLLTESYQQTKKSLNQLADNIVRRAGSNPAPSDLKDIAEDEVRRVVALLKKLPDKIEREFGEISE